MLELYEQQKATCLGFTHIIITPLCKHFIQNQLRVY